MKPKELNKVIPTGSEPAGIKDTATERVLNLPQPPCKRNILHDPHNCHCAAPCPACVNPEPKFWSATLPRLDDATRNSIEKFIVKVRVCDFYSWQFNVVLPELLIDALQIDRESLSELERV